MIILLAATVSACSAEQALRIAASGDPRATVELMARSRARSYAVRPTQLAADIRRARQQFETLVSVLRGNVTPHWGEDEAITPANRRYVKYTQNYESRAIVHFDTGDIRIETLDTRAPQTSLRNAIITTLLTPDDPRAVDLYSDKPVRLSGRPYLYDLVTDARGRPVASPAAAEHFADYLLAHAQKTRAIRVNGKKRVVHSVHLAMVQDFRNVEAQRYAPLVDRYAQKFDVSKGLVFAIMKTESDFNPFAVSSVPAYGLMQLVPATAGQDAYAAVHGSQQIPSRDYLFDPAHNIELGTAYLNLISDKYLAGIQDPVSREYCTIAAYNGGAGGVLRLFSPSRRKAVDVINRLGPAAVYRRLRDHFPNAETRRYLVKVLDARRDFVNM
jgi:membrane-bound lytic murein transglycosylase C